MTETRRQAWEEVADRLDGLGLKLKFHLEQAAGDERDTLTDALGKLASSIDQAFDAVRAAAKDPALKDDVKAVGSALSDAVTTTLSDVGDDLRRTLHRN
jgi:hypothetical protein